MARQLWLGGSPQRFCGLIFVTASLVAQNPVTGDLNELREGAFAAELRGDHSVAADAFLQLCERDPGDSRWFLQAGENLGKSGRFNDAMSLLTKARKRFSNIPELGVLLCKTLHLKAEDMRSDGIWDDNVAFYYREAAVVAKELLALDPKHLEALLGLAQAEYALGDATNAAITAQRAVMAHPESAGGYLILGKIHFNRFTQAKTNFIENQPEGVAKADAIAEIHRQRELATTAFSAARRADPNRAYPLVALGDIDAWMGDLDAASDHYRQALLIDSGATIRHQWLRQNVSIEQRIELYDGVAVEYLETGDRNAIDLATIDWYRALARFDRGDWQDATRLFADTLAHLPDILDTYYYLVQSSYWSGDVENAAGYALAFADKSRARYADLIRDDHRSLSILRLLTKQQIDAKQLDAGRALSYVLASTTQTAADWNNYAYLCRQTGQFDQSLLGYEMAMSSEPNSPQLLNDTAVVLQYDFKDEASMARARELYTKAIQLADEQLAAGSLTAEVETRIAKALADAKLNLAAMK